MDQNGQNETLLNTEFLLYPKNYAVVAKLTTNSIIITPHKANTQSQKEEIINLKDVTGCHVTEGNCTTSAKWHICIFAYPLKKKFMKGEVRQKISRSLGIPVQGATSDEDNRKTAEAWKRAIKHLITGHHITADQVKNLPEPERRNLVVYINPFSGQGKSMQIYKSNVKKMFAESEIQHTVFETAYPGHARVLAKDLNIQECDGIVIVSGDGLVHEVLNGLMDRTDWAEAIKTPIGIVPGGSGNALAASIVYASTGQHDSSDLITDSLFEVLKGKVRDLSLVYIQQTKKNYYSFLNVGWGFVADVDIESEKYRSLGNARFTVGCAVRVANLRKYHGMVSYLPAENLEITESNTNTNSNMLGTEFKRISPEKKEKQESCPLLSKDSQNKYHLSSSLHESLPTKWLSIEGEFVWIMPVYLSHVGKDMFMMPQARLDEDVIYLYCLKSDVGRRQLLNILLSIADGTHLGISPESTMVVPCKAFRLEPFTNRTGLLTVDGEAIAHEPLQATVTPIKASIMCSSN